MKKVFLASLALLFLLASCLARSDGSSTTTTPETTATITATSTPISTATAVPTPTATPPPPVKVTFYHLRLEYRVTSDWGLIEFGDSSHILAVHQAELSCSGQPCSSDTQVTYSATKVDIYRPFAQVTAEPEVVLILDLALAPDAVNAPFTLISQHGAFGGSGMRFLYAQSDTWTVLQEINHYWVNQSNVDTSATKFSLDLTPLAQNSAPQEVSLGASRPDKLVLAFYYPWFPDYGWSDNTPMSDQPLIRISSSDPKSVAWQIEQAQSAGIDGFIMSYNSDWADSRARILLQEAEKKGFKVSFLLETLDSGGPPWPPEVLSKWIERAYTKFSSSPAFLKINGKPVMFIYASPAHPLKTWETIFSALREKGVDFVYIATGYDLNNLSVFDGIFDYAIFGYEDLPGTYLSTSRAIRNYSLFDSSAGGLPKLWVVTVSPGFNSTPYGENLHSFAIDRGQGEYYLATIDAALRSDPDWIVITSWNEYGENTHIEPSQRDGDFFLNLTRDFIKKWKYDSP